LISSLYHSPSEMQAMSQSDFEGFANTCVNAPVTMSPNSASREVQLPWRKRLSFVPIRMFMPGHMS
jgi:hypothetical protein